MRARSQRACYSRSRVGRLENIIARNRRSSRPRERLVVMLTFGSILLLIIFLMVFTDLGLPPEAAQQGQAGSSAPVATPPPEHRVDGVKLWKQPAQPAQR